MYAWLRRVTPDLFIAAVIALLITLALHKLEAYEGRRIADEAATAAVGGLSLDERIEVVGDSIQRSTRLYIPFLVAVGGAAVGLACRLERWASLTAVLAIIPALLTGASFHIDLPRRVLALTAVYVVTAGAAARLVVALRRRLVAARSSGQGLGPDRR